MKLHSLFLYLFTTSIFVSCGNYSTQDETGGASETINASVVIQDSSVMVNIKAVNIIMAEITLIKGDYNPLNRTEFFDSVLIFSRDAGITFTATRGKYNVIIRDRITAKSLLFSNIELKPETSDTISDTLSPCGSIQGTVSISQNIKDSNSTLQISLTGTPFTTTAETDGVFNLSEIPAGSYSIIATVNNMDMNQKGVGPNVSQIVEVNRNSKTTGIMLFFSN